MFRYENIVRGHGAGLAALTGRRQIALDANRADDKPYAALYPELWARLRIPADLAMEINDRDPYLRHFSTEQELTAFKANRPRRGRSARQSVEQRP